MGLPHVLAVPYPALGHVIPMMELAQSLSQKGIKVTIVVTEFIHKRMKREDEENELIEFTTISDGLEPWEDRSNVGKMLESMSKTLPHKLEALIHKIDQTEDEITCLIVDYGLKWPSEFAQNLTVKRIAFLTAAAAWVAVSKNDSELIDLGAIDADGAPLKDEMIQLSQEMPAISNMKLLWTCMGDPATQRIMFHANSHNAKALGESMDRIVCNSCYELEAGALDLVPKCIPIGPLLGEPTGHFWAQDTACLSWLDQQPPDSTIYVSFGSSTFLDETQFREVALGLEITNRPFLWVVRDDLTQDIDAAYPPGFKERIKSRGKIVGWAPQQKVLLHPSVACFLTHCGWNSTLEGISNGVPFLCWPYFADQLLNETYIVDHWEVGLGFAKDDSGIVRKEEIVNKVEKLLTHESYKARALQLQAKTIGSVKEGGSSHKNFNDIVNWIKEN